MPSPTVLSLDASPSLNFYPVAKNTRPYKSHIPVTRRETIAPPATSPDKPFDRISFAATTSEHTNDDDDRRALDRALPDGLAPAKAFAAHAVGQAVEVLQGHRPIRQLQTWLAPGVYRALAARAGLNLRLHGPAPRASRPAIRRLYISHPRRRIAEVSIVIHDGFQIRAVALRLEIRRERWQVTALEIA
ncbi:hypothetical protein JTE88_01530 [Arcanobacterium phocisimile]|uniref:Energy transducer TonB n=1 Tax=Arcanobacterium phocisimile TaxID=1302235 RepID=A0ABX7IK34_9ACTO|nr:Rv3235 family protein [Arcanobacterium phocisimile]QRV02465.1 hypothetical protein JTE88_01530 [Arcanobacterium phocisimile]